MKIPFQIGDKVLVTELVEKVHVCEGTPGRDTTKFITKQCEPFVAIYIGYRKAAQGYTVHDEDGLIFRPQSYFTYALVVRNPRQNPVKVSLSNLL